jgi:D-beta-D-heptose 7-phosphate kinase/D-beta-D-heptose 1-phosphate adenosyltransferase
VLFGETTPISLIRALSPDVLVKGGDYDPQCRDSDDTRYIVGSDFVRENGGEVTVIPFLEGFSSTRIIEKIRHGKS